MSDQPDEHEQPSVWQAPTPGSPPPAPPVPQQPWQQPWQQQGWQQPVWYPPGQGWAPAPSASVWSILSLVTAIIGLVPVAVVCGIVALTKLKHGAGGKGLAIAGLVVSGVWVLIGCLIAVALLFGDNSFFETGGRNLESAGSTTIGACLTEPDSGDGIWVSITCAEPHDGEIYAVQVLGEGDWPGADIVDADADDVCRAAFKPYVGTSYLLSDYDYDYFAPDESEWLGELRQVVCIVTYELPNRSVKGSGD